jgi:hypothetical protein
MCVCLVRSISDAELIIPPFSLQAFSDARTRLDVLPGIIGIVFQPNSLIIVAQCGVLVLDRKSGAVLAESLFTAVEHQEETPHFFCDEANISIQGKHTQVRDDSPTKSAASPSTVH